MSTLHHEQPIHGFSNAQKRYAFLVHSSESLTHDLPPDIDNKPLARQRRKRTSVEDQLILEDEYKCNPKPDKAARIRIVERVALSDREVQIWFQNRRQNTRRKSRPLLPHEVEHYQRTKEAPEVQEDDDSDDERLARVIAGAGRVGHDAQVMDGSVAIDDADSGSISKGVPLEALATPLNTQAQTRDQDSNPTDLRPSSSTSGPLGRTLSAAKMRLSLGSDGTASIVSHDTMTPSPPRKESMIIMPTTSFTSEVQANSTQTSFDATSLHSSQSLSTTLPTPLGRAKDSRAWEFWCDKDARTGLEQQAAQEEIGSAAGAIELLRSNSTRGNSDRPGHKRMSLSASFSGEQPSRPWGGYAKRQKSTHRMTPLLQRSQSMQNSLMQPSRDHISPKPLSMTSHNKTSLPRAHKLIKATSGLGIQMLLPSADTDDKENWSPERLISSVPRPRAHGGDNATPNIEHTTEQTIEPSAVRLQPTPKTASPRWWSSVIRPSSAVRPIVPSSTPIIGHEKDDAGEGEDGAGHDDADGDGDVQYRFRRDGKSQSASEEEDLQGVQGLLSLSQGAWK